MARNLLIAATMFVVLTATSCDMDQARNAGPSTAPTTTAQLSTSTSPPSTTTTLGAVQDVVIRTRPTGMPQRATLQIPSEPDASSMVVVLLHGAGSDRRSVAAIADAVAAMGVPVLNATWAFDAAGAEEAAADGVCAVAYANENASAWGADPERVVVIGHSGGGHIGMLTALSPGSFPGCDAASRTHVWAYLGMAGDPAAATEKGNAYRFFSHDPDLLALMDNYSHVGGNPNLIARFVHGTADQTVPIALTQAFHDALVSAGYDSEFVRIEGADHFDPIRPTTTAGRRVLEQVSLLMDSLKS
ncbi:MAG: alpha/beta hydrolase family protein [Acidimicrobiia bacterium]